MSDFSERLHHYQALESQILNLHPSLRTRLDELKRLNGGFTAIDLTAQSREITEEQASTTREKLAERIRDLEYMHGEGEIALAWNYLISERKALYGELTTTSPPPPRPKPRAPEAESPESIAEPEARKEQWSLGGLARPTDRRLPKEVFAADGKDWPLIDLRVRLRELKSELDRRDSEDAFDLAQWSERLSVLWKEALRHPRTAGQGVPLSLPQRITNTAEAAEAAAALAKYLDACRQIELHPPQQVESAAPVRNGSDGAEHDKTRAKDLAEGAKQAGGLRTGNPNHPASTPLAAAILEAKLTGQERRLMEALDRSGGSIRMADAELKLEIRDVPRVISRAKRPMRKTGWDVRREKNQVVATPLKKPVQKDRVQICIMSAS